MSEAPKFLHTNSDEIYGGNLPGKSFFVGGKLPDERRLKIERAQRVFETRMDPVPMSVEDVVEMDSEFRAGGKKQIWGRDIESLVAEDFLITKDMYRVTTFGPVARVAAEKLVDLCERYFPNFTEERFLGIEGNTGAGSQTYALAKTDRLWIDATVESDTNVAWLTRINLNKLGLTGLKNMVVSADIVDVLAAVKIANNGGGRKHNWVMFDPDWEGKHYGEEGSYSFNQMSPNGEELIGLGLTVAPIVGIKAPSTTSNDEILRVAGEVGAGVHIVDVCLKVGDEELRERMVYFVDESFCFDNDGGKILEVQTVELSMSE